MKYFNHSKKDIRSLTIFYMICSIFGVVPCYSFEKSDEKVTVWKKIYGLCLMAIIFTGTAYSLYIRQTFYVNVYTTTHLVLDYIDEFFIVMLVFTVIVNSCFLNRKDWIKLNNNIQYVDEILENKGIKANSFLHNPSIQFFAYILLYIIDVGFLLYTWTNEMGLVTVKAYAMHEFCYIYDVLLHFLVYNICLGFKYRYDDLNELLLSEANEYWEKKVMKSLRKIENLLQCLSESVDSFNNVFGTPLIFIAGKSIIQLLTCLNFLTNNLKTDDMNFKQKVFVANLLLVIYTLMSVSFIMITADAATAASKRTISLCYKFQEQFVAKSEARQEFFKLAQQANASPAVITASNYFQINKATLFGIFSTTTTYFIVILQFNQSLAGK